MLCENCGKPITVPGEDRLDPLAKWGDWCYGCIMDDLSGAQSRAEWEYEEKLDRQLRQRPGRTSGAE